MYSKKIFLFDSAFNIFLRSFTLLSKFYFMLLLNKYVSLEELGTYSIFTSIVGICVIIIGFDFYIFNIRNIVDDNSIKQKRFCINNQFFFHVFTYIIVLPLMSFFFIFDFITFDYVFLFYFIILFEHMAQELYRLHISLGNSKTASLFLFLRSGFWVWLLILLWFFNFDSSKNLKTVFLFWGMGSFLSFIAGVFSLYDKKLLNLKIKDIDINFIKRGIKTGINFFVCTLGVMIISVSDRFMIDIYMQKHTLGIYSFFSGILKSVDSIIFAGVIMIIYPKLLASINKNEKEKINKNIKNMIFGIILLLVLFIIFITMILPFLLNFIGKKELFENIYLLYLLFVSSLFINLGYIPHYILFSKSEDKYIRNITLIGCILNILLNILLVKNFGLTGIAIASIISYLFLFTAKSLKCLKYNNIFFKKK